MTFVASACFDAIPDPKLYIATAGLDKLMIKQGRPWHVLDSEFIHQLVLISLENSHYLGDLNGLPCFSAHFSSEIEDPSIEWVSLRSQLGVISDAAFQLAGRALQIAKWDIDHQYCGACGVVTESSFVDRARVCPGCERRFYPRISPCVIGLVQKGDCCLLARGQKLPEGMFSTLAGFIDPGESAEQAFSREVMEEVSIEVKNIEYVESQAWPFPGQLMLGFRADWAAGELKPDGREIIEACWFHRDNLPLTPPVSTISGRLISAFAGSHAIKVDR